MVTVVQDRGVEILRHRLSERDVTVEEVWDYICLQHRPLQGQVQQNLASFITEDDIKNFWLLHDWWEPAPDKPLTLPTPSIAQFCFNVNHIPDAPPVTFKDAMFQFYNRAVAHCQAHDIDSVNPGESAEERRRRRNRERMAKARSHRKVPESKLKHDEALAAQVRGLEEQCEQLKQQAAEEDARLKEDVLGYQKRMYDASAERKQVAEDFKQRIENLRAEIRSLTAKQ